MNGLWIIGAGGHAKVVLDAARAAGLGPVVGLLDDDPGRRGSSLHGVPIVDAATPEAVATARGPPRGPGDRRQPGPRGRRRSARRPDRVGRRRPPGGRRGRGRPDRRRRRGLRRRGRAAGRGDRRPRDPEHVLRGRPRQSDRPLRPRRAGRPADGRRPDRRGGLDRRRGRRHARPVGRRLGDRRGRRGRHPRSAGGSHGRGRPGALSIEAVPGNRNATGDALERKRIYLSPPTVGGEELAFLGDAVASNWIAPLGPHVDAFERELAARAGVGHAAALSSGTAALHLALKIARGRAGRPGLLLDPDVRRLGQRHRLLRRAPRVPRQRPRVLEHGPRPAGRRPGGRRPPGSAPEGGPGGRRLRPDRRLRADRRGLRGTAVPIVEDAAEALGASYRGVPAGSFGRVAAFSFNGNKIITTSGGGMLVSDDDAAIARARKLATQAREPTDDDHYLHHEVGYNYRMSNLLAAVGRAQLRQLDGWIDRRRAIFNRYSRGAGRPARPLVHARDPARRLHPLALLPPDRPGRLRGRPRGRPGGAGGRGRRVAAGLAADAHCSRHSDRPAPSAAGSPRTSTSAASACPRVRPSATADQDRIIGIVRALARP